MVDLLEKQLSIEPSVVFPVLQSTALKRNDVRSRKQKFKANKVNNANITKQQSISQI